MDSELLEEFEIKVRMHQGSVLSHFFAVALDVFTEFAREGSLSDLLHANDIVLLSERIKALRNKYSKWQAFESNGLKVNLGKTKVMVSGGIITKDGMSNRKVEQCGLCWLKIKTSSGLCDKWIHGRCARLKMVTPQSSRHFTCKKCEGILERQWNRKKIYVMK